MRSQPTRAEVRELADAIMDSYVSWRQESAWVLTTYERWGQAAAGKRDAAYGAYLGALEREELAAAEYRRMIDRAAVELRGSVTAS
jgi:uncharacterized protein (DUF305 family)